MGMRHEECVLTHLLTVSRVDISRLVCYAYAKWQEVRTTLTQVQLCFWLENRVDSSFFTGRDTIEEHKM
jgi:hypothetical protein